MEFDRKRSWRALAFAPLVTLVALSGCGGSSDPSASATDLTGTWEFWFTAADSTGCPVDPALVPGCGGGGTLELVQWGPTVSGTWNWRGGCQSCGSAGDFGGAGTLDPVPAGRRLVFEIDDFLFYADLPPGRPEAFTGTVTSSWDGAVHSGEWHMTRVD